MKKVLVVEDDAEFRKMVVDALIKEGLEVVQAGDGKEGLTVAMDAKPDLIVTDLMMPHMDGLTMIRELREQDWGKDIPVTILTNFDGLGVVSGVSQTWVSQYIIKSDMSLDAIVKKVIETIT